MKVDEFAEKTGCTVFASGADREIRSGYCGDFLSNIISRAPEGCCWLTVMNNVNVAAVASLIDCACIILCEGVTPDEALRKRAEMMGIWLLGLKENCYETAKTVAAVCGV